MTKWISVKDKLPDNDQTVIVAMYSNFKRKVFVSPMLYLQKTWHDISEGQPLDLEYEVTHWQSLPEPPNE